MLINTQRAAKARQLSSLTEVQLFKESAMSAKHTPESLNKMSLSDLTALYNEHAAKPIKKFACSKEVAVVRTMQVLPKSKPATKKSEGKGERRPRGLGICKLIAAHLKSGKTPADTLAAVLKKHPEAKTTIKCVYWVAHKIKSEGAYEDASL